MVIIRERNTEPRFYLTEALQKAGKRHLASLEKQMARNEELRKYLTTPIKDLPLCAFLTDNVFEKNFTLLAYIKMSLGLPELESYFIVNSKNLYVGFIAISIAVENNQKIVDGVKVFSFCLSSAQDENLIVKDVPKLMNDCLKRFPKVSWKALKGNRANTAYEIYRKKNGGTREDLGNSWRYTCYGADA